MSTLTIEPLNKPLTFTFFSPATVANVSCGFDVLGFALESPGDEIAMRLIAGKKQIIIRPTPGCSLPTDPTKNVAGVALQALMDELSEEIGFEMQIIKGIKPGSGIGSSAASAAGAVMAANELLGNRFSKVDLVRFAMQGERLASGTAHADNVAPAIFGGFTLIRSIDPLDIVQLNTPEDLFAVILHPQIEIKTSDAREILKRSVPLKDAVKQWGNVGALVAGLMKSDYELIGRSLQDVIVEPTRSMLIPGFEAVKQAAKIAGALGGGISGSGPSIFMLCKGEACAAAVRVAVAATYDAVGVDYEIHLSKLKTGA